MLREGNTRERKQAARDGHLATRKASALSLRIIQAASLSHLLSMNSCLAILLLLGAAAALSRGATINRAELRCQCINTESKPFSNKQIANIELIPHGPHCMKVEIIATLKTGNLICLDPEAKWVKRIIHSMLHRSSNPK